MTRLLLFTIVVTASVGLIAGSQARATAPADKEVTIEISSRSIQPGEILRLDVTCACEGSGVSASATVFGQHIPLARSSVASEWHGLIGLDVDRRPGTYRITVALDRPGAASLQAERSIVVQRKVFRTRRLRVDPDFVT